MKIRAARGVLSYTAHVLTMRRALLGSGTSGRGLRVGSLLAKQRASSNPPLRAG